MKHFKAPWSPGLIVISTVLTALCFGLAVTVWFGRPATNWSFWVGLSLLLLTAGCALFTVRGYEITPEAILVERLLWATRLPRAGLQSARFVPNVMRWSLRTFGNGGFFSVSGFYWNRALGSYRAFVTNPRRTVVLAYARHKIVVSPDAPEEFVAALALPSQ